MSALELQPTPLQEFFDQLAQLVWHLQSFAAPVLWVMALGSLGGLVLTWRLGQMDKVRLFGASGAVALGLGCALWLVEAVSVYAAGLCL